MTEVERMLLDTLNRWNKTRESESKQIRDYLEHLEERQKQITTLLEGLSERVTELENSQDELNSLTLQSKQLIAHLERLTSSLGL